MNRLPEEWVKKQLEEVSNPPQVSTFMGVPLTEMTRDELMAVAISGWRAFQNSQIGRCSL